MRDWPVFMRQSMKVLNVFNTLTLIQIFWKTKSSLVETTKIENTSFPFKTAFQNPMLRQIEWRLQNRPIMKSGVLTPLFFWKICFSFSIP